jgi:hypothetical protein
MYEYNIKNYKKIINYIKMKGYEFSSYTNQKVCNKSIFLRHDIDYSLDLAVIFAKINNLLGVKGTFFIQVRCPIYNILAFNSIENLKEIVKNNQDIGIHLVLPDNKIECIDIKYLEKLLNNDYEILSGIIPETKKVFAWHNPSSIFNADKTLIDIHIGDFINAYGKFAESEVPYYADSNMRYTLDELIGIIDKGEQLLQYAIAPMQWWPEKNEMKYVMSSVFSKKIKEIEEEFLTNNIYNKFYKNGMSLTQHLKIREIIEEGFNE